MIRKLGSIKNFIALVIIYILNVYDLSMANKIFYLYFLVSVLLISLIIAIKLTIQTTSCIDMLGTKTLAFKK